MSPPLIVQLLALVTVANGTPVLAKKVMGNALAIPLDGGAVFVDGRPLLGRSKTIRGLVLAIIVTTACAPLIGLEWQVGALVGALAMAGDLASSFAKRRLGLAPSSRATGLDQIPESLLALMGCRLLLPVSALDVVAGTALFFAGELVLSRILFQLHIRDRPF